MFLYKHPRLPRNNLGFEDNRKMSDFMSNNQLILYLNLKVQSQMLIYIFGSQPVLTLNTFVLKGCKRLPTLSRQFQW